jgi:uncharacterized repeat protein (TIGR03803 family)
MNETRMNAMYRYRLLVPMLVVAVTLSATSQPLFAQLDKMRAANETGDNAGPYQVLHSFQGHFDIGVSFDPLFVRGLAVDPAGTIYGESQLGGSQVCDPILFECFDLGAEFKLDRNGKFTVYPNPTALQGVALAGPAFGSVGPMLLDRAGNLVFASTSGGFGLRGGVFSLNPGTGEFNNLFSFTGTPVDGTFAAVNVIRDANGTLYGTTLEGGQSPTGLCQFIFPGCGTVYKLDAATFQETVLHTFTFDDGFQPAGLAIDKAGNLVGAAIIGSGGGCRDLSLSLLGCGSIFRIDTSGNFSQVFQFQHSFICPFVVCTPTPFASAKPELLGWGPNFVVLDDNGNIFGTTGNGGNFGLGVIFKIDSTGQYSVLHHFAGPGDGFDPQQLLLRNGTLYGINLEGGNTLDCDFGNNGCGTVFSLDTKTSKYRVLHTFSSSEEGTTPTALAFDQDGNLVGTNLFGGNGIFDTTICTGGGGCGNVFRLRLGKDDDERE